jgi:hypothetical protein
MLRMAISIAPCAAMLVIAEAVGVTLRWQSDPSLGYIGDHSMLADEQ